MGRLVRAQSWRQTLINAIDANDPDMFLYHFDQMKQEGMNPYRHVKFDQDDGETVDNELGARIRELAGVDPQWTYVLEEIW